MQIETDVPVAAPGRGRPRLDDPLYALSVGESFVVPVEEAQRFRARIQYVQREHGGRYVTRRCENGIRIHRVE